MLIRNADKKGREISYVLVLRKLKQMRVFKSYPANKFTLKNYLFQIDYFPLFTRIERISQKRSLKKVKDLKFAPVYFRNILFNFLSCASLHFPKHDLS